MHWADRESVGDFPWPAAEDGAYAKRFLLPLLEHSAAFFIANIRTRLYVLRTGEHVLPVTVNEEEYDNSYVCSPYTHYVSYAKQELYLIESRLARRVFSGLLTVMGGLFRAGQFNRTVHANNWLVSTNLYPSCTSEELRAVTELLLERFPDHALVYRSLNRTTHAELIDSLQREGFRLVPSRQIYFLEPSNPARMNAKARWLVKRDYGLLASNQYEVLEHEELRVTDVPRLAELYRLLYLDKYSYDNPQFGERFFELALRERLLHFQALRSTVTGRIDAVLGYFCRNGVMTTPVFGYDTSLPQELGLYRMLSAVLIKQARSNGHLLHESSGAAQFKRNRGAVADIEYSAVYDAHLPWHRRAGWAFLQVVLNRVGVPLLQKYKL
ncbi:GNAT family N-acetyltransferase [Paenibacillus rigui]|uniref:GNAT family N-acetyltransferase n=1 Tax=Paenibacillus rigui TaxID=554312 RepID=A0A229UI64_9BACL|nr:GNAT family N-acetyltransferase [Paenibacillus rigui]